MADADKNDLVACPENIIIDIGVRKPGERLVLYLDELAFGNPQKAKTQLAPGIFEAKQKLIDGRVAARVRQIESGLTKARKQIAAVSKNPLNQFILDALSKDMEKLNGLLKNTRGDKINFDEVEPLFARIVCTCGDLSKLNAELASKAPMLVYDVPNLTSGNFWILPSDVLIPGRISDVLEIRACRGEYEPASLLIKPLRNIDQFAIKSSDLVGPGGKRIKAENIDIKYVQVWYQAGGSGKSVNFKEGSVLTPELLVNDPNLVKVDYETQRNSLKLTFPDAVKYVDISDPRKIERKVLDNSEFPVKDAPALMPVDLKNGSNQQIWITVHVPEDTQSGLYEGTIELKGENVLRFINLKVEVLPFELSDPYYTASIDYHAELAEEGTIGSYQKNRTQMLAELKDMRAHGLTNIQHYFRVNEKALKNITALRALAGFSNDTLFLKGHGINYLNDDEAYIEQSRARVREIIDMAKKSGAREVYFYGRDEVTGDTLRKERKSWTATREEGGKIFSGGRPS